MKTISGHQYQEWSDWGLMEFDEYADCVEYVNQSEYGDGQLEGLWYYVDYDARVIYHGSFGNDNSPGASHYTTADVYMVDENQLFLDVAAEWESCPEYLEEQEIE